ncbi:MAG: DUF1592 domain-containing protein [Verrucomicrobiae bacterium]|nr:DUF1592 domain-containing protein [Verrucomicrobiae bacterium]
MKVSRFQLRLVAIINALLIVSFTSADEFQDKIYPVLEIYCFDCHDGDAGKPKGDFDLFPFLTGADAKADPEAFRHVRDALHFLEMPPEEKKQPSAEQREFVIDWINREILRQPTYRGARDPGPPVMRRMTRLEYNNTVRDLLGLESDVFSFSERLMARRDYFDPSVGKVPDELDIFIREYGAKVPALLKIANLPGDNGAEHGYLNQGDTLNVTPLLMERYLSVASSLVHHEDFGNEASKVAALLGIEPRPKTTAPTLSQKSDTGIFPAIAGRDFAPVDNIKGDAPGGSDQSWLFRDHISSAFDEGIGGVFQHPEQVGARVPGKGGVIRAAFGRNQEKALLINPTEDLWFVDFATAHETSPPANIANGLKGVKSFRLGLKLDGVRENEGITSLGVVVLSRSKQSQGPVTLTVRFSNGESASLTDEIETGAGEDNTFFSWQAPPGEAITDLSVDGSKFTGDYVLLDDLGFITGKVALPEDRAAVVVSETRRKESLPVEAAQKELKTQFAEFLARAFRREVSDEEGALFFSFYEKGIADGQSRQESMAEAIRAVLSSPRFLFLTEKASSNAGPIRTLRGHELANRLSYFLWSSMPDESLMAAARSGELNDPAQLEVQIQRMLRDPKAKELSESFAYQWLQLNVLLGSQPDPKRYASFYSGPKGKETLAAPLLQEALLLFETVLIENRPLTDLIDPDFTWLNSELIKFYGFEKEFATQLRSAQMIDKNGKLRQDNGKWFRCRLPNRTRGGVLCMGSTLTLTSLPLRTSPVYRGAWATEVVFNRPPPPPPAMVGELGADDQQMQEVGMTLRQKLSLHREKAACAGCHSRIDPLGFPLENFDAIGQWRESYGKFPVDSGGILMREHDYAGIVEFKDALRQRDGDFHRGFIRHLLAYALGRHLESYDEWTIDELAEEVDGKGLQDLIMAIAKSYPFLHTRNAE